MEPSAAVAPLRGELRLELGDLDVKLTRAGGGSRAALELAAAYRGERTIVLGFAGVGAVRRAALSRLLAQGYALLEPWARQARLELRSLRPSVRRELLLWTAEQRELELVGMGRRALTLAPQPAREERAGPLGANRRRMLLLAERDGEHCVWCGKTLSYRSADATVDHVRCRSDGGADAIDNLVLACAACNHRRANRSAELWLRHCLASELDVDERAVVAAIHRAQQARPRVQRLRRAA